MNENRSAQVWSLCAFGAVGVAAGFFTGISRTPMVGTLVPLLFTLLGGTAGFFILRKDLDARRKSAFAQGVLVFTVSCVAALYYGASTRGGEEIPLSVAIIGSGQTALSPEAYTAQMMLRNKLARTGASASEAQHVLRLVEQRCQAVTVDIRAEVAKLVQLADAAEEVVGKKLQLTEDNSQETTSSNGGPASIIFVSSSPTLEELRQFVASFRVDCGAILQLEQHEQPKVLSSVLGQLVATSDPWFRMYSSSSAFGVDGDIRAAMRPLYWSSTTCLDKLSPRHPELEDDIALALETFTNTSTGRGVVVAPATFGSTPGPSALGGPNWSPVVNPPYIIMDPK